VNDVAELKQFARLHARAQNISGVTAVLDRIGTDAGDEPGSWPAEWRSEADRLRDNGKSLEAVRHYNMARFPFVDGPARELARDNGVGVFRTWAEAHGVERLDVPMPGGVVGCWATGLSHSRPRPLVLVCGGIVSTKEQWAPVLVALRKFGLAGIVTEMPGVGENSLRYQEDSWRMLPALLDAADGRALVDRTCTMTLSFSGHLALRAAAEDRRIRGIVTAGVPVRHFFTDPGLPARLPRVTADTLRHLTGTGDLAALRDWAIPAESLAALDIPIACTASARDEIVPAGDVAALRRDVRDLWLVEHDDVHGSPNHVGHTRLWAMRSLLRMHGRRTAAALLGVLSAVRP
jgi:hypothetical protein